MEVGPTRRGVRPRGARHRGPQPTRAQARPGFPHWIHRLVMLVTGWGAISLIACLGDLDPTSPRGSGLDLDVVQTTGRWLGAVASVLVPIALTWWLLGRWWTVGVAVFVIAMPLWIVSLV